MKRHTFTFLLLLTSFFYAQYGRADQFDLGRQDHQAHIAVSYGLALTCSELMYKSENRGAPVAAFMFTLAIGAAKEVTDPVFSMGDMKANAIGAAMGSLFSYTLHF